MADGVKVGHASYSSVDSWLECGEKYRLTRIEKFPEDPAWWSVGGSAVHKASEWYDLGVHDGEPPEFLFAQAFDLEIERAEHFDQTPRDLWRSSRNQDEAWWRANGPDMVARWIEWRQWTGWQIIGLGDDDMPGVEVPFEVTLGGMPVKGFIDRVFVDRPGQVVIVDLKSGARRPASGLQLGYYRAGLESQYGVTADVGGYWMARQPLDKQFSAVHLGRYTQEFIGRFVAGFKQALDTELFVPHVTSFCKTCGVSQHCWAQK